MTTRVKKLSVRFVPVSGEKADFCKRMALELQAESILRAYSRHNNRDNGKKRNNLPVN